MIYTVVQKFGISKICNVFFKKFIEIKLAFSILKYFKL